jgi:YggT family protein
MSAIAVVLHLLLGFVNFLIIARVIISWLNADPFNPIVRFVVESTDPLLRPFKKLIPPMGALDLTPIALLIAVYFCDAFFPPLINDLAAQLRMSALR